MESLTIREARSGDAEALAAVYRNAYRENRRLGFPASAESVTAGTVATWIEEHHVFVATVEEVVGGVRLQESDSGVIKLSRLGVHEEWKGRGIGSELLAHGESVARSAGSLSIWLTTPEDHPYLPDLYRSRGYEKTGDYPLPNREYDEIVMEKQLR